MWLVMDDLGTITMLTFFWFFTSHYLKIACLFRLTFSKHDLTNLKKIKKRKKLLIVLDAIMYSSIAIFFITVLPVFAENKWMVFVIYTIIYLWIISAVNFFALRRINKYTKLLELEGIVANEKMVTIYILLLCLMAFCYTMQLVFQ